MKTISLITSALLIVATSSCSSNNNEKGNNDTSNVAIETIQQSSDTSQGLNLEQGKPVCIDFFAEWCPPCQQMKPIFHEMEKKYGEKIQFISANTDEYPELAHSYGVEAIPTFIFINSDHQEIGRITGACSPSEIETQLNEILKHK